MSEVNKNMNTIPEKNKASGLSYVYTECGLELPVLDITHPLYTESIKEESLEALCKESAQRARSMKEMPDTQKMVIVEKSYIFGKYFHKDPTAAYLSGMSTYMLKLGPGLIGGGEERNIDRMIAMGVVSIAARMRLRDICRLQANTLIPRLMTSPGKELCLVNIAGGAAADSINTLILILVEDQSLLKNRKIEINVFDIDIHSTTFAGRCLEALKAPGCHFHGLDISFNHIKYNWADTRDLIDILAKKKDCVLTGTSEGGLFEYANVEEIKNNLDAIYDNSPDDLHFTGSVIHDIDTVDPTMAAMAEESRGSLQLWGIQGLRSILEKTNWKLDITMDKNPVYGVFTLKKELN
jgi:hypothetical protein